MSQQTITVNRHEWFADGVRVSHMGPCTWANCQRHYEAMLLNVAKRERERRYPLTELMERNK